MDSAPALRQDQAFLKQSPSHIPDDGEPVFRAIMHVGGAESGKGVYYDQSTKIQLIILRILFIFCQ